MNAGISSAPVRVHRSRQVITMRWRVTYDARNGFKYVVQPPRLTRHRDNKAAEDTDDRWPEPREAWRLLRAWEASHSGQDADEFHDRHVDSLARNMQVNDDDTATADVKGRDAFRVRLTDCIETDLPPGDVLCRNLTQHVSAEVTNPLSSPMKLKQAIVARREREQPMPGNGDLLSSLPLELLDLIVGSVLDVHLNLVAVVKSPQTNPKPYTYTPSERAALANLLRSEWAYFSALPFFHVSRLLRNRTVAVIDRQIQEGGGRAWNAYPRTVCGSATLRLASNVSEDEARTEPLDCGMLSDADHQGSDIVKEIPRFFWEHLTHLNVVVEWDFSTNRLLSPLTRLLGFEDIFHFLQHIRVQCQVVNGPDTFLADSTNNGSDTATETHWQHLANGLYGPNGAYHQIGAEIGRAMDISVWAALTKRTGIWPGYCLRGTCTPETPHVCPVRLPQMAQRMPIIDVELLPLL